MSLIFFAQKPCIMHQLVHIRVIKTKIRTQKSQREIDLFIIYYITTYPVLF